jgi:hypothetical protein
MRECDSPFEAFMVYPRVLFNHRFSSTWTDQFPLTFLHSVALQVKKRESEKYQRIR